jgi:predicted anti-sigma-YlaC factor YlaD
MTCTRVRTVLSARLDGEAALDDTAGIDDHLAGCPACRDWLALAEQVTRAVRVQPVDVPDLTDRIMASVPLRPRRPDRQLVLRWAVGLAAAAQLLVALPVLFSDPHASREMASLDIALAVGFAYAAYRPERARAYVPVAFVLAACLAVTSAVDIASSSTALVHEVGHVAAVVQAILLWALGRTAAARPPGPAGMVAPGPAA